MNDPSSLETIRQDGPPASSTSSSRLSTTSIPDEGRFLPGALLGGRYRIISLLGRGGMGEVYRATDLTLGASVALKFLPEEAARNQRLLERFHGEVRVARQVSHPAICRVYDIGEAEGLPFLSMEFLDGEDLASLLRRIGRLPADKALQIARRLCAGLAAAHDRGVIHRDLKPANVMIDKRGDAFIMDFGLAAIADQLSGPEARNGTPAYMSPEQLKGAEVTARSDIYALGLVLYELFTGKRPFEAKTLQQLIQVQEAGQLTSMTSLASDVDPAVEKAVRRCLEPDPLRRPASAISVAAALPGGDPLAAALAAGEMPSPELVASAGKTEGLALRFSLPCLLAIVFSVVVTVALRDRHGAAANTQLDLAPDALRAKARETATLLGYPRRPTDSVLWLVFRGTVIDWLSKRPEPRRWTEWFAAEAPIAAFYRESLTPLNAEPYGEVTRANPPPTDPGMISVYLDGHGRILEFRAIPYGGGTDTIPPVTMEAVFRAAGYDFSTFTETTPTSQPATPADQLRAWKGPHPVFPGAEVNVEIAAWKNQITSASFAGPWVRNGQQPAPFLRRMRDTLLLFAAIAGILIGFGLARRNWKLNRVDRKGAFRLAAVSFLLSFVSWFGHVHAIRAADWFGSFYYSAGKWLAMAGVLALLYLALEPAIRSRWPHSLVAWSRVLAGNWRDPMVASHILTGAATGTVLWALFSALNLLTIPANEMRPGGSLFSAQGVAAWAAVHAERLNIALLIGLVGFFLLFVLRAVLRKDIFAAIVASLILPFLESEVVNGDDWLIRALLYAIVFGAMIFVMLRFGMLTTVSAAFFINTFNHILTGTNWNTWYAPYSIATICLVVGISALAFWRSLAGRDLLGDA